MNKRIRSLRTGEPFPEGEPRRYRGSHGYIRVRWDVGPELVECYEHRWVMGVNDPALHVHHINHQRDDNRPENLEVIDPAEHYHHHHPMSFDVDEARRMYESGMSTPEIGRALGVDHSNVYRALKKTGFTFRSLSESQRKRRAA